MSNKWEDEKTLEREEFLRKSTVLQLQELIDDIEEERIDVVNFLWDCESTTYGGAPKKNPSGIEKHTFVIKRKVNGD